MILDLQKVADQLVATQKVNKIKSVIRLHDTGTFSREWQKSVTVPIPKQEHADSPDNYRGEAFTS